MACFFKSFYLNQFFEFNGVNGSYVDLIDFDIKDIFVIIIMVKVFDFSGNQVVFSKVDVGGNNLFVFCFNVGQFEFVFNEIFYIFGLLEMGFYYIVVNFI